MLNADEHPPDETAVGKLFSFGTFAVLQRDRLKRAKRILDSAG